MVEYFTIEGLDRPMFRCEALRASLSVDACKGNWLSANAGDDRREKCRSCPIGAKHAGQENASCSDLKGSLICARCNETSSRGWLLGKHLCVSCWNREREWVTGKNAKGSKPTKMLPLEPRAIRIMEAEEPKIIYRQLTQHDTELVVSALRDSAGNVTFIPNKFAAAQFAQREMF